MTRKSTFTATLVRHAHWIALANLAALLIIGAGISRLHLESGIKVFFNKSDPNLLAWEQIERTYGKEDNILFVIEAKDGDVFTPEILATIATITEKSWFVPNSRRVDSLINYLYPVVEGDDIHIGALIAEVSALSAADIARVRDIALTQRPLSGRILSQSGDVTAVNVSLNLTMSGTDKAAAIAESVTYARKL